MESSKALAVFFAVALLALSGVCEAAALANETAWQRLEDRAEWELPVDADLHRHIGAAGGDLRYVNVITPGAMMPDRPACIGTCPANGRGGYDGRGCHKVFGCGGGCGGGRG